MKDASRRVRGEGLNGAAVAAVMRDTGLTHGGFYKHFKNKDELLVDSLRESFREILDPWSAQSGSVNALKRHNSTHSNGCKPPSDRAFASALS